MSELQRWSGNQFALMKIEADEERERMHNAIRQKLDQYGGCNGGSDYMAKEIMKALEQVPFPYISKSEIQDTIKDFEDWLSDCEFQSFMGDDFHRRINTIRFCLKYCASKIKETT